MYKWSVVLNFISLFLATVSVSNIDCKTINTKPKYNFPDAPSQLLTEWISIPAGNFTYGNNDIDSSINYEYAMMKYEVTNAQYVAYLDEAILQGKVTVASGKVVGYYNGDNNWNEGNYEYYNLAGDITGYTTKKITWDGNRFNIENGYENHPVIFVTWFGADAFAKFYGCKLPSEQEWEKAARGNTGYEFPWGNNINGDNANFWDSGDPFDNGTTPVGYYNGEKHNDYQTQNCPSPFGIYDMAGNVWEWTDSFFFKTSNQRVARGGSFGSYNIYLYSYERHHYVSTFSDINVGFRCVKMD